jgi:branched-chain amino acid transport system permease protein
MTLDRRALAYFGVVAALVFLEAMVGSWNTALGIVNMALLCAIMALGVNMQWGYAGLFNVGIMGFVALGGLAPVLVSTPPVTEVWTAGGGWRLLFALAVGAAVIALAVVVNGRTSGRVRIAALLVVLIGGFFLYRALFDPAVAVVEAFTPATYGNVGGMNLPVLLSWPAGALLAAGAAWVIGKTALGLRSDYLAIATLGIGEIILAVMRNEDWLARGVKNIIDIPRPIPYEVDLQADPAFVERAASWGTDPVTASTIGVKLMWAALFLAVMLAILWLSQRALNSPWGRMMRAIRDNEVAAEAMGKDVTRRHLQVFVLGSAICGLAGAMLVTLDGQLVPGSYNPLRFTFLVWLMVIVGGSGNNYGAVIGAFLTWYLWVKVEPWGNNLMLFVTSGLPEGSALKEHLIESSAHMRMLTMGLVLLLVLRFAPRGLVPER